MITRRPIVGLPDELKDGRQVLLAFEYENATVNAGPPNYLYETGRWYLEGWVDISSDQRRYALNAGQPTHFAEITAP